MIDQGGSPRRQSRIIEKRYIESARRIASMLPSEQITLQDLANGVTKIRLVNGVVHEISSEEARAILEAVPPYFWRHMKVPLTFRYVKTGDGSSRYEVQGDVWQRRLVEILLTGSYTVSGISELSVMEFKKLISRYSSLVFVSLVI